MSFELPIDPRLRNVDNELVEIVADEFMKTLRWTFVGVHLRDARKR